MLNLVLTSVIGIKLQHSYSLTCIFLNETKQTPGIAVIPAAASLQAGLFIYSKPSTFIAVLGMKSTVCSYNY